MGNESENSTSIKLLEQRLKAVENNMAAKSDIAYVSSQLNVIHETNDNIKALTKKIEDLINESIRREENDKHIDKMLTRMFSRVETLETKVHSIEIYVASDKPYKEVRTMFIRGVIGFFVAAILGSVFYFTKN